MIRYQNQKKAPKQAFDRLGMASHVVEPVEQCVTKILRLYETN